MNKIQQEVSTLNNSSTITMILEPEYLYGKSRIGLTIYNIQNEQKTDPTETGKNSNSILTTSVSPNRYRLTQEKLSQP